MDSTQWTSGVYTEQRGFHSVASTPFAGADLTALVTVTFPEDLSLQEIENVCFTYEGLTLEVDVSQYLLPGYLLVPEHPAEGAGTVCYLSPIGFQCTVPGEGEVTLELLRTDGTVVEMGEDLGLPYGRVFRRGHAGVLRLRGVPAASGRPCPGFGGLPRPADQRRVVHFPQPTE